MNFSEKQVNPDPAGVLTSKAPSKKMWKKLANMIISQDEIQFRKSMISINNTLYLELEHELQNKMRSKFWL